MFDIVIENGFLIDPEKKAIMQASIALEKGKISAISKEKLKGRQMIDAISLYVSPGFIDVHGHIEGYKYSSKLSLMQGITTTVGGNCGSSVVNMRDFFIEQEKNPCYINQAELFGMTSSLREYLSIEDPSKPADKSDIIKMQYLAEKAFNDGAAGLSIGLAYAPGTSDEEVFALSNIAAKYNRIVAVDTRIFTANDLYSLVEVINIGRKTGARVQVSHFVYQYGTGLVKEALSVIDKARSEGIDIRLDSGMYTDWATGLKSVLFDIEYIKENSWNLNDILIVTGEHKGKRLNKDLYYHLREETDSEERVAAVIFTGNEDEIYETLEHPFCMISTDIGRYEKGEGHPQIAGSFPRFFRKMVRELGILSLEEAVYKATYLPADTMRLENKGRLQVGCDADIVIFDLNKIKDNAGFLPDKKPDTAPDGIEYVIVNGHLSLEKGKISDKAYGKPIIY